MILGSHNSLSYAKPQWFMKPFAWFGRCQDKTIQEQYDLGVRYFDFRLRFQEVIKKSLEPRVISGHGLLSYNIDVEKELEFLNSKEDCTVRLTLEISFMDKFLKWVDYSRESFKCACNHYNEKFKNIIFVGGYEKGSWIRLVEYDWVEVTERYWIFKYPEIIPYPKWYSKMYNIYYKDLHIIDKSSVPLVLDFVEFPLNINYN